MQTGLLYHVPPGSETFPLYLPAIKSKHIQCVSSYITKRGYSELWGYLHKYCTCTYDNKTLYILIRNIRTVPAYFLEQFHEHYKSLLIMFVVTSKLLLYLVWSVSFQRAFFSYGVQKRAHNWITMSAGTQVAEQGRNDLIHALTGKNFGTHCTQCKVGS